MYRLYDLKLMRERTLSLQRSLAVMHAIDESSPFFGQTAATMAQQGMELTVMLVGLDDTSMQSVHASHTYYVADILLNARHVDILSELPDGSLVLDLDKFHDVQRLD